MVDGKPGPAKGTNKGKKPVVPAPPGRHAEGFKVAQKYLYTMCQCGGVIRQHVDYCLGRMHRCARCAANVWYQRQLVAWQDQIRREVNSHLFEDLA